MAMQEMVVNNTDTTIYKYSIGEFNLVTQKETIKIDPSYIRSMVTDYDYKNNNMPMLFLTLNLDNYILDQMLDNQNDSTIVMNIQKYIANSQMPGVKTTYIKDSFVYFIPDELNNDERRYGRSESNNTKSSIEAKDTDSNGQDFTPVTVGLMSQNLLNNNKKNISGSARGNLSSILFYATSHLNLLMEPINNNKEISQLIIPPRNSVANTIRYINSLYTIYPTPYRFFMDFDVSYLISSSGKPVLKRGDKMSTVKLILKNSINSDGKVQGMTIDKESGVYSIIIPSTDVETNTNNLNDKSYSSIKIVSSDGTTQSADVSISAVSSVKKKEQVIRITNDNMGLIDNLKFNLKSSSRVLSLNKCDIDSSIFTINRKYVIESSDVFGDKAYNGEYILTRKREIFLKEDDVYKGNISLILEKIAE